MLLYGPETVWAGGLLLAFGLQWLRKAIPRASGYKALHDEAEIFRRETEAASRAGGTRRTGLDWCSFTLSLQGVFLEGLEIALIVITLDSSEGNIGLAALAAGGDLALLGVLAFLGLASFAAVRLLRLAEVRA